jgi:hypothetical protein
MTAMKHDNKTNGWDRASLKSALVDRRDVYAVFDGRSLSLYIYDNNTMRAVVWACAARGPWSGSNLTLDAQFTAALVVGIDDWMAYNNIKVLNF